MRVLKTKPADIFGDISQYVSDVVSLSGSCSTFVCSSGLGYGYYFPTRTWDRSDDGSLRAVEHVYASAAPGVNPVCRLSVDVNFSTVGDDDSDWVSTIVLDRFVFGKAVSTREIAIELLSAVDLIFEAMRIQYFSVHWDSSYAMVSVNQLKNKAIGALVERIKQLLASGSTLDGELFDLHIEAREYPEAPHNKCRYDVYCI